MLTAVRDQFGITDNLPHYSFNENTQLLLVLRLKY